MPYKDPERQREAMNAISRRHRAKKGTGLAKLVAEVQQEANLPEPPSREWLLKALGVQAREGNVAAIKLLLDEYRKVGEEPEIKPQSKVLSLVNRRTSGDAA